MNNRVAGVIVGLLCSSVSLCFACIWIHGTTIDGHFGEVSPIADGSPKHLAAMIGKVPSHERKLFEEHNYFPDDPIAKENDYAVTVLLRGDPKQAIKVLTDLELKSPGVYYTAANLGTAYELAGNDEEALKWILEGIKRNPDSHMRTEWVHARVLEAKIKLKTNPQWFASNTITGADFSRVREKSFELDTLQRKVNAADLFTSLYRQISVRVLFVKPKDAVVAQMLKELAMIEAQIGILERADAYARLAVEYGLSPDEMRDMVLVWRDKINKATK